MLNCCLLCFYITFGSDRCKRTACLCVGNKLLEQWINTKECKFGSHGNSISSFGKKLSNCVASWLYCFAFPPAVTEFLPTSSPAFGVVRVLDFWSF